MIEVSTGLAIQLIDCVALLTKVEPKPAGSECVPQARLLRRQVDAQKPGQEILTDHQMSDLFLPERLCQLFDAFSVTNGAEKKSRQLSAVVKIVSLTIIRSPPDKEKIYFRIRRCFPVNITKRRILRERSRQIAVAAFRANQIRPWCRCCDIFP